MKLEIGSGRSPTDGFLHVDIRALSGVDVVCDVRRLPFQDNVFDAVLAKHVIEHFSWRETGVLLKEWVRVLKPGALISVQCPNLAFLCDYYARYYKGEVEKPIWYGPESDLFGSQDYEFNYHKTGFSFHALSSALRDVDVTNIIDLTCVDGTHDRQYQLHVEGIKNKH